MLCTLAEQQSPPQNLHDLSIKTIVTFMEGQFDPKRFVIRERFKFWSEMKRKPGESIQELVTRIRQDAAKCDFSSIVDPQDEAMRTRFICSVNNEAVLKALFKIPDDELTFSKAIQVALGTEDAAKIAKETAQEPPQKDSILKIQESKKKLQNSKSQKPLRSHSLRDFPKGTCPRCGKTNHRSNECRF